jgi:membrane protein YqaA with SNARE-associated domain
VVALSFVDRRMILRMFAGLAAVVVAVALLGVVLREPIRAMSEWFVARWGLYGLFAGTLITDVSPVPIVNEPLLLFAHAAGVDFWRIWLAGSFASMGAGIVGYWLGRSIGGSPLVDRWIRRSGLELLMKKRGAALVLLAAVTPIPFAAAAWTAGACKVPFFPVAGACGGRFLKVAAMLAMIAVGWSFA